MITIINGTNRTGNISQVFSKFYRDTITSLSDEKVNYLTMEKLPKGMINNLMFTDKGRSEALTQLQEDLIIPSKKFVFVIPEYNGGIPGVLKLFIDACSTFDRDSCFKGKKVAMIGIASGRAGNLRGMDHLTGVMNYLGSIVMPNRLPISSVQTLINEQFEIKDSETQKVIKEHVQSFLEF